MARIPYTTSDELSEPIRQHLEKLPVKLNIFRMLAHAESNFKPFLVMGDSILRQQKLDARLRELAILRVAKLSESNYEWAQHVTIASGLGVSADQIRALDEGKTDSACFSGRERMILRAADEIVRTPRLSDETLATLAGEFSNREIVEIVLTVGFYIMVARLLECTGVDLENAEDRKVGSLVS